jgi:hypothetical protein
VNLGEQKTRLTMRLIFPIRIHRPAHTRRPVAVKKKSNIEIADGGYGG